VTLSGRCSMRLTVANGNTSVAFLLQPGNFQRLLNLQKNFEFYRFTSVMCVIPPWARYETSVPKTSLAASGAFGYYPELTTATTTAISAPSVLALESSLPLTGSLVNVNTTDGAILPGNCVLVGQTQNQNLRVPRNVLLATPVKFWRCNSTASSEDFEITQGLFMFAVDDAAGANTVVLNVQLRYTVEFAGQNDATVFTLEQPPDVASTGSRMDPDEESATEEIAVIVGRTPVVLSRTGGSCATPAPAGRPRPPGK